jgi:hypothetical protein
MNQQSQTPISLDYAGDVVALERIRALFVNSRPLELGPTEGWLVRLIGQKAMMQVMLLEEHSTREAIGRANNVTELKGAPK